MAEVINFILHSKGIETIEQFLKLTSKLILVDTIQFSWNFSNLEYVTVNSTCYCWRLIWKTWFIALILRWNLVISWKKRVEFEFEDFLPSGVCQKPNWSLNSTFVNFFNFITAVWHFKKNVYLDSLPYIYLWKEICINNGKFQCEF